MYSDFIEDRLAENSEHIALLKKGIKNFAPTWLESNFRQEIKQEAFKPVDDFFDNIFQSYDDNEKLFIYKSTYSQAGFEESIKNLEKFVPGMKVEITKTTFDYTPYLKFTKQNDGTFLSEVIDNYDYSSDSYVLQGNDTLSFEIVEQSSKYYLKLSASSPSDLNSYMLKVSDGYFCLMNPVVLFGSETPQTEFPKQEEGSSPPVYNITVSTTGEVFKDYELFQARFGYLVKELLYYYDVPTVKYNITYEINAINKEQHIIHVTPRIFKFIPISGPGVN